MYRDVDGEDHSPHSIIAFDFQNAREIKPATCWDFMGFSAAPSSVVLRRQASVPDSRRVLQCKLVFLAAIQS